MANKIIHKHSSVVTDGKPKLPTSSQIEYGELAVNYAKDNETISLKNSENEIVEFKSDKYYQEIIKENEEITAASLTNLDERVSAVDGKISENNEAISASLNDLNERIIVLDADLSNKSDENHTHEGVYATYNDLSDFATEFENSLSGHTSDDSIHVTSSDKTNWNKISNKSDSSHNHGTLKLTGDVTGSVLISSGTSEMTLTATVVNDSHSHSNYSLTGHNHDDRYYTESEIDDFIGT